MNKPFTGKIIKCLGCEKDFYIPINRFETAKYCCRVCKNKFCTVKIQANCEICGKLFEHISSRCNKAKYCSRLCYHRSQKGKGSREYTCANCGVLFMGSPSRRYKFCTPKCRGFYKRAPEAYVSFSYLRRALWLRGFIKKCEICGYDTVKEILGIHHKDGNRKNNSYQNLQVLCPNCHSLAHHQHIPH